MVPLKLYLINNFEDIVVFPDWNAYLKILVKLGWDVRLYLYLSPDKALEGYSVVNRVETM